MPSASTTPRAAVPAAAAGRGEGHRRGGVHTDLLGRCSDDVAERLTRRPQRHGSETVWPYYYAGTMGLVQRDGINRLRHAMRYSREHLSICGVSSDAGWLAGVEPSVGSMGARSPNPI